MAIQNASSKEIERKNHQVDSSSADHDEYDSEDDMGKVGYQVINDLNIGAFIMMDKRPCRIDKKVKSKPGKHGAAKYHVKGKDIFTDRKMDVIMSSHDKVQVPELIREEYQILEMDGKYLTLLNLDTCDQMDNFEVDDEDLLQELKAKCKNRSASVIVAVISFGVEHKIVSVKLEE
jgi:translation initiation factor 5A